MCPAKIAIAKSQKLLLVGRHQYSEMIVDKAIIHNEIKTIDLSATNKLKRLTNETNPIIDRFYYEFFT